MKLLKNYAAAILFCASSTVFATTPNISGLSPNQACRFLKTLQTAAQKDQKQTIAKLVKYPLRQPGCVPSSKKRCPTINNQAAFLAHFDTLMTADTMKAINQQTCKNLFYNYQGVMIGSGEAWFGPVKNSIKIIALNH